MNVEISGDLIYMLAHSGRSDFKLVVQNIGPDGVMDCRVQPYPGVIGVKSVQVLLPSQEVAAKHEIRRRMLEDAVRDFRTALRALEVMGEL